jgi:hypothetical protein
VTVTVLVTAIATVTGTATPTETSGRSGRSESSRPCSAHLCWGSCSAIC